MYKILRSLFVLISFILFSGCASVESNKNSFSYYDEVKNSVISCAESLRFQFQEITSNLLTFDVPELTYFIIVSEQDAVAGSEIAKYCHVTKSDGEVVYTSGQEELIDDPESSEQYTDRYASAYSGRLSVESVKVTQFKLVNGIWRYIDGRDISSF